MKLTERILRYSLNPILARNAQFKGRHKGETCYIVGNGASLKNMELDAFSDHVSIGLAFLCLHNDFRSLNIPYYVLPEPCFLYPFRRNSYSRQFQENTTGKLLKTVLSQNSDITLFTSITNIFGSGLENTFYFYHFGNRQANRKVCDICRAFSFVTGSLHAGIGVAINMGFKKAILVGCDYTFTPCGDGHFFGLGPPVRSNRYENIYERLFAESANLIDLEVITDIGESRWLPYQDYESFTGRKIQYRENIEIVNADYLKVFNRAYERKQYSTPIYPPMSE